MDRSRATAVEINPAPPRAEQTAMGVLLSLSLAHLLNDTLQAVLPALYPVLKDSFHLSFSQIGLITFTYQLTASLLQPLVGFITDRRPQPYSLSLGMGFTLTGLIMLSQASHFGTLVLAAALTGIGSSIFHPEASRLTRLASGGRHGLAQSVFQMGGNLGTSLGPLLVAFIIGLRGQSNILWFTLIALLGLVVLIQLGNWYRQSLADAHPHKRVRAARIRPYPAGTTARALTVLILLVFSKQFYLASITSYYTFYLIERFNVSVQHAQILLFVFLFSTAAGILLGGPLGDRFGRKWVLWFSILGVAPFTLALPYAGLTGTVALTVVIGLILSSAFSAILVYAQDLLPGNVGLVSGLFFGLAFGVAGIGSALLGRLADNRGVDFVYHVCSFLPLLGLCTALLPELHPRTGARRA